MTAAGAAGKVQFPAGQVGRAVLLPAGGRRRRSGVRGGIGVPAGRGDDRVHRAANEGHVVEDLGIAAGTGEKHRPRLDAFERRQLAVQEHEALVARVRNARLHDVAGGLRADFAVLE